MSDAPLRRELALACLAFLDVEPEAHIRAAAKAGFDHVSLRVTGSADPVAAEVGHEPRHLARLRTALAESGVGVLDVEVLRMGPGLTGSEVSMTLDAAEALGARHLLVVNGGLERAEATDRLGEIVSLAAGSGVRPCLEPMPFSRCRNLREAVATAVPAGAAVLVDVLHLFRSGDGLGALAEALRRHGSDLFPYVQVCDSLAEGPEGDSALRQEAVEARLLPGRGELPLRELVSMLPSGLPLAVEAPTAALRTAPPDVRAVAAMTAARSVLGPDGNQAGRLRG